VTDLHCGDLADCLSSGPNLERFAMRNIFVFNLSVLAALALSLNAAEPATVPLFAPQTTPSVDPTESNRPKRFLTILDCVQAALKQNINIGIQRLNPAISQAQVQEQEGIFDINWVTGLSENEITRPAGYFTSGGVVYPSSNTFSRTYTYQDTLSGLTPLGTKYQFGLMPASSIFSGNQRIQSSTYGAGLGPDWTMSMGATVTQPLLKNFGWDVNTYQIRIARKNKDISYQQFILSVMQTVAQVKQSYYNLVYDMDNVKVMQESVDLAKRFLDESRKRMEVGTMSRLDVVTAEAELSQNEGSLIDAIRQWQEDEFSYKQLISRDVLSMSETQLVPVDRPSVVIMPFDSLDSIRLGLENRPEYLQSKLQLEINHIYLKYYKNQLLPQVDLTASYGFNANNQGINEDFSQLRGNIDSVTSGVNPAWSAGLTVTVPLGNITNRGYYRQYKLAVEQALLLLKQTEQNIIVGVENQVIEARNKGKLIISAQATTRLRLESYLAEVEKLKAGTSTTYTVLQMQRDLNTARVAELQAINTYNQALVALSLQEGTILKRSGVSVESDDKK
jgi:outer membrane protein